METIYRARPATPEERATPEFRRTVLTAKLASAEGKACYGRTREIREDAAAWAGRIREALAALGEEA